MGPARTAFAATTWPRPRSKPHSGTRKPSRKICRSRNFSAARAKKFRAAFRSEFSRRCRDLIAKVEKELAAGYQRIKIKIKPGQDIEPVRALRERFPRIRLMVDANSAYTLEDAPLLKQLDAFYLIMIEQPLGWDDIFSHVALQRQLETPICLDECIHDVEHARAAIELGACRIINIKLGRVGGHTAARRIHDLCQTNSIPVWCGGMLESGIGRAHNIAMSSLPNFSSSRRCLRQPPLLGRRHHRARSRSIAAGNHSRSLRSRNRLRAAHRPHRIAHSAPRGSRIA